MDPITLSLTAAVAAIGAGAIAGTTEVGKRAIIDSYDGLKSLLKNKLGAESEAVKAVEALENKPESEGRKVTLQEEIEATGVADDDEILEAARALLARIEDEHGSRQTVQQIAHGTGVAQASHGGSASVNIGDSALPRKP